MLLFSGENQLKKKKREKKTKHFFGESLLTGV